MKRRKRFIAALLAVSMVSMSLAGCGSDTNGTANNTVDSVESQATGAVQETAVNQDVLDAEAKVAGLPEMTTEEITLTYACWGLAEKGEIEARDKQLAAFQEAYPNITVEFVTIDQAAWNDGLTTLAATGSLPDVFWVNSVTDAVANEWALDVTDYYENDSDAQEVYTSMVENARLNGKLYCMPTVMFPYLVFLNKTMFEKYNEPLPSYDWTIDDFKEIAERITHPDEFYFGTSNPNYTDYFPAQYNDGQSAYGWDGSEYHFDETWVEALNLKYNWIDTGVCEWAPAEDKLRFLGDEAAWPPGFGRSGMHFDWTWTIAAFEDAYSAQSGCEFLYYPQPAGPTGKQMAIVDYGVVSASTEHPREAWELMKWTSWGKEACLNRYDGYKEAGLSVVSRMPVINNEEAWDAVRSFTDREDFLAVYDHLTDVVPSVSSVAPGYNEFNNWMTENEIWVQLDNRQITPADIADELTQKANEFKEEWLANHAN